MIDDIRVDLTADKVRRAIRRRDSAAVFEKYWAPFIASLEAPGEKLSVETVDLDHFGSSSDEKIGGRLLVAR